MTDDDDGLLADYDLSAWDAPAPAPGLADAVIARAKQPAAVGAIEPGAEIAPRRRLARRLAIGAAIAAVAVASGAVAMFAMRTPAPHRSVVEQADGAASWTVASDDQLEIVAGGGFATIEASGARLRVEVTTMNATDPRVLGTSAATAALVAMVTVIVFDGRATVVHDGRTQEVVAGSTLQVGAPVSAPAVALDEQRKKIAELEAELVRREAQIEALQEKLAPAGAPAKSSAPAKTPAPAKTVKAAPDKAACDAKALEERGKDLLTSGANAQALVAFEMAMACKPDPALTRYAYLAACDAKNAAKARQLYREMPANTSAGIVQVCLRNGITLDDPPAAVAQDAPGTLRIQSKPMTRVMIDGLDTGKDTPVTIQLVPGKHKVTLKLDDNKYTWAVTIQSGKTESMIKTLE